jgi:hypothetical protein
MNHLHPITVVVECGSHRTELSFGDVVSLLGRVACAKLVQAVLAFRNAQAVHRAHGKKGGRGIEGQDLSPETNAQRGSDFAAAGTSMRRCLGGAAEDDAGHTKPPSAFLAAYAPSRLTGLPSRTTVSVDRRPYT